MIGALLGLVLTDAFGAPNAQELELSWEARRAELEAHAAYPFRFSTSEWEKVASGAVLKRRERLDGSDRVLGVLLVPADLDTTWVAVQDPHGDYADNVVMEELPGSTFQRKILYQRVGLPWPLVARQWVVLVRNNLPLIEKSGGSFWERTWGLTPERGADAEDPKAVWLPINEGGWFLASAHGHTLLGYHVRTSIGGVVPDEAALRWSFSTLENLLRKVADRAVWARTHYDAQHAPLLRPDGSPIAPMAP